jgi:hypothetical protein
MLRDGGRATPFGINYLAIVVAAITGWLAGAAYYGVLAKAWVAA